MSIPEGKIRKQGDTMKYILALSTVLAAGLLMKAQGDAARVVYVEHDKVAAAIGKGGSLVVTPDYTVTGSHREKPGNVEVHDKETDVIYMIEGDATFVTGGTVVGLHQTKAGQSIGSETKGGESHHLTKG